jgi:hypothetical protein
MNKDQGKFNQNVITDKKSKEQSWAEPLAVSQLNRT